MAKKIKLKEKITSKKTKNLKKERGKAIMQISDLQISGVSPDFGDIPTVFMDSDGRMKFKPRIEDNGETEENSVKIQDRSTLKDDAFTVEKEHFDTNFKYQESSVSEKDKVDLIDSIDFKNGENKISIRFSRKHNRMFRIQIYLNDEIEVRPVTYTGSSTGYSFWNLLKGALKK